MKNDDAIHAIHAAREALGDPEAMTPEAQYEAVLKALYRTMELASLAGFDTPAVAVASANSTIAFAANTTATTRREIASALRRCADEIAVLGDEPPCH